MAATSSSMPSPPRLLNDEQILSELTLAWTSSQSSTIYTDLFNVFLLIRVPIEISNNVEMIIFNKLDQMIMSQWFPRTTTPTTWSSLARNDAITRVLVNPPEQLFLNNATPQHILFTTMESIRVVNNRAAVANSVNRQTQVQSLIWHECTPKQFAIKQDQTSQTATTTIPTRSLQIISNDAAASNTVLSFEMIQQLIRGLAIGAAVSIKYSSTTLIRPLAFQWITHCLKAVDVQISETLYNNFITFIYDRNSTFGHINLIRGVGPSDTVAVGAAAPNINTAAKKGCFTCASRRV